jgi:hypothetical protein
MKSEPNDEQRFREVINVGSHAAITKCGSEAFGFGIFEKAYPDGRRTWIIAGLPKSKDWQRDPPSSVLEEFDSPVLAEAELHRWSIVPAPVPLVRKPRSATAGACRRNGFRPRKGKGGPGQMNFNF